MSAKQKEAKGKYYSLTDILKQKEITIAISSRDNLRRDIYSDTDSLKTSNYEENKEKKGD